MSETEKPDDGDAMEAWLALRDLPSKSLEELTAREIGDLFDKALRALPDHYNQKDAGAATEEMSTLVPALAVAQRKIPGIVSMLAPTIRKKLGLDKGDLREAVRAHIPPGAMNGKPTQQGSEVAFEDRELWPDPVDGAELLNDIERALRRFMVLPSHAAEAVSLWVVFTYALDVFEVNPRLIITSPERRCGKTRLMAFLSYAVNRPVPTSNVTPAALFRLMEAYHPTLLIDEADTIPRDNMELRGLVNSGHTREAAYVLRVVGEDNEVKKFSTWGPMALASIGQLPETWQDRSVIIRLKRKGPGEQIERGQGAHREMFSNFGRRTARWVADNLDALAETTPEPPEKLDDRAGDNWRPLLAIADLAGGSWPERTRKAANALSGAEAASDETSWGEMLLADLRELFEKGNADRLSSVSICESLGEMHHRPWPEYGRAQKQITPRQLARILGRYRVKPRTIREDGNTWKGYHWKELEGEIARYARDPPSQSVTPSQVNRDGGFSEKPIRHTADLVTDRNSEKPAPNKDCYGVTDRNPLKRTTGELLPPETPSEQAELDRQAGADGWEGETGADLKAQTRPKED